MKPNATHKLALGILAALSLLFLPANATAQIPDEFTNLKILPKDISKGELVLMMRAAAGGLGVRCAYCHVGPDNLKGMDFATDEKDSKRIARQMMKMVQAINGTHLKGLNTGRSQVLEVKCITCHHRLTIPMGIEDIVAAKIEAEGAEAAIAEYRKLREEKYGGFAYDFSEIPINSLAEQLARSGKLDEALALLTMNVELKPDVVWTRILLSGVYRERGETEQAVAALEKALEIEPDNPFVKKQLQSLRGSAEDQ